MVPSVSLGRSHSSCGLESSSALSEIVAYLVPIPALAASAFWLLAIGYVLLAVAMAVIYWTVLPQVTG